MTGAPAGPQAGPPTGVPTAVPDHRPRFPDGPRLGVAVLGCGRIAQSAHLPACSRSGVDVVGVRSRTPATTAGLADRVDVVRGVHATAEDLLADPEVAVVDIAGSPADPRRTTSRRSRSCSPRARRPLPAAPSSPPPD